MPYPREWHSFCLLNSVGVRIDNLSRVMNQQRHPMPMKAHDGGFSLIEILVVIGVIGILVETQPIAGVLRDGLHPRQLEIGCNLSRPGREPILGEPVIKRRGRDGRDNHHDSDHRYEFYDGKTRF